MLWKKLILLLFASLFLRLFLLSSFPVGFHVDEVKVGWNSYSMLKTGLDDWGNFFPLHYNSFGDYRPTGYFFLSTVPIFLFGLTEFSTRFTPSLIGALTIISLFWFTYQLSNNKRVALISAFILTFNPWHIALSRASSEGVISMFLVISGLVYFQRFQKSSIRLNFNLSLLLLSLSYLMYHSSRLLAPVLSGYLAYQSTSHTKRKYLLPILLMTLCFIFFIHPSSRGRFSQVSILPPVNVSDPVPLSLFDKFTQLSSRIIFSLPTFVNEYLNYFNPKFYINAWESKPYRYSTSNFGLVTQIEFFLFVVGLIWIVRNRYPGLPLGLLLLSILPAALTLEDSPNLHRSLFIIPFFVIICALGFYHLAKKSYLQKILTILFFVYFSYFEYQYFINTPTENRVLDVRNFGTKELILSIPKLERNYSYVLLTNYPDHLYPWYGFYFQPSPKEFNQASKNRNAAPWFWKSTYFSHTKCPSELLSLYPNSIAVDRSDCVEPNLQLVSTIDRPDKTTIFSSWTTSSVSR